MQSSTESSPANVQVLQVCVPEATGAVASDPRLAAAKVWLQSLVSELSLIATDWQLDVASADASFRRYFRLQEPDGTSLIVMDAPPPEEDCRPFVAIAAELRAAGLNAPELIAADIEAGFLLLSDLGGCTYGARLEVQPELADALYGDALVALAKMQLQSAEHLPVFDAAMLHREMQLLPDWLAGEYLGLPVPACWSAVCDLLVNIATNQPVVYVHRDYHCRNLMVHEGGDRLTSAEDGGVQLNPGVLDFQDAVAGPVTYDVVSLLKDCYIAWPREQQLAWLDEYRKIAQAKGVLLPDNLIQSFDLMGVQRHLKAAGIFARLWVRDGKPGYLPDVPRTLNYIVAVADIYAAEYPALKEFSAWLTAVLLPALAAKPLPVSS